MSISRDGVAPLSATARADTKSGTSSTSFDAAAMACASAKATDSWAGESAVTNVCCRVPSSDLDVTKVAPSGAPASAAAASLAMSVGDFWIWPAFVNWKARTPWRDKELILATPAALRRAPTPETASGNCEHHICVQFTEPAFAKRPRPPPPPSPPFPQPQCGCVPPSSRSVTRGVPSRSVFVMLSSWPSGSPPVVGRLPPAGAFRCPGRCPASCTAPLCRGCGHCCRRDAVNVPLGTPTRRGRVAGV